MTEVLTRQHHRRQLDTDSTFRCDVAFFAQLPTEMPSDIQSVRVTTEVVADKESDEHTLAVHVIVDRRVPVLGWVLMVSALLGLAAMVNDTWYSIQYNSV